MLLSRHAATLLRPQHCRLLLCSAPFSAPSWGLLGCGRLPRLGCVYSVVSCATGCSRLSLPCSVFGFLRLGRLSASACCCSDCHSSHSAPHRTWSSCLSHQPAVVGRPAPWTGTSLPLPFFVSLRPFAFLVTSAARSRPPCCSRLGSASSEPQAGLSPSALASLLLLRSSWTTSPGLLTLPIVFMPPRSTSLAPCAPLALALLAHCRLRASTPIFDLGMPGPHFGRCSAVLGAPLSLCCQHVPCCRPSLGSASPCSRLEPSLLAARFELGLAF